VIDDPAFQNLTHDFDWNLCGILTQKQTANLLNDIDIFVDYSSHQAMGLTALEAMANGSAVILPLEGGAVSFANDHINALVVDTRSFDNVWNALSELIENHELRKKIQRNALFDACKYFPEKPALRILEVLFEEPEHEEAL
jgi:glycosyltransferase involved in cell wall biosynthesis